MDGETSVGMGELEVTDNREAVLTTFVGSCVALCLYDPQAKVGGMAHIMLPDGSKDSSAAGAAKYADRALENTMKMMTQKGASPARLVAKIAGGAKIFAHEGSEDMFAIGARNTDSVRKLLQDRGISITGEDVGQTYGRWVRFDIKSGSVKVGKRGKEERVL